MLFLPSVPPLTDGKLPQSLLIGYQWAANTCTAVTIKSGGDNRHLLTPAFIITLVAILHFIKEKIFSPSSQWLMYCPPAGIQLFISIRILSLHHSTFVIAGRHWSRMQKQWKEHRGKLAFMFWSPVHRVTSLFHNKVKACQRVYIRKTGQQSACVTWQPLTQSESREMGCFHFFSKIICQLSSNRIVKDTKAVVLSWFCTSSVDVWLSLKC